MNTLFSFFPFDIRVEKQKKSNQYYFFVENTQAGDNQYVFRQREHWINLHTRPEPQLRASDLQYTKLKVKYSTVKTTIS